MAISPYADCPCGSGKQFKWCCQSYYPFVEKALTQHEHGQNAAAEQTLAQLVEKFPKVPQAWGYQAQILFLNDNPEAADAALQQAFDLDPNFAFGFWLRGMMRLQEGEAVGALLLLRKAAELLDPNARQRLAQVSAQVAELEMQFGRPVAARAALARAIAHAPQVQEYRQAFESAFGPESRMLETARRAYAFRPSPPAKADRWRPALESAATGRLTDALRAFEIIAEADATEPAAWFNLGLVRAWLGDNLKAIEAVTRSIDLEPDEKLAEEAGALAEVLRGGHGLDRESDHLEHRTVMQVRNREAVVNALSEWGRSGRLAVIGMDREQGTLAALFLEATPDLGVGAGPPLAHLLAYMNLEGDQLLLWHGTREMLDRAVDELRTKLTTAISDPQSETVATTQPNLIGEIMLFPTREGPDPSEVERKLQERARDYFEEKWVRRPLKSLGGATPLDAAGHPTLRRRLPGLIRYLQEGLREVTPREEDGSQKSTYDFDRLRRKLGLTTAPPVEGAAVDFDTLSAAGLGGLNPETLSDDEIDQAFRAALRLDAPDLAGKFARAAVGRGTMPDRYPFFNHLVKTAREENKSEEVIRLLTEGEQADAATNEGRRRVEYVLGRGQASARAGDASGAYTLFKDAIAGSPAELRLYATAAETMLGRKQGAWALEFAEGGLKQARVLNSRDGEQQFLELVGAAKKQSG